MKLLMISNNSRLRGALSQAMTSMITPPPMITAASLKNGRQQVLSDRPDIVLLDIDAEGFFAAEEYIKRLGPRYSVPIIVFSARNTSKSALISAGAIDVITRRLETGGEERFFRRVAGSIMNIKNIKPGKKQAVPRRDKIIAIGGSTGSTNALPVILKDLKPDCPPVVCVLHMPEGYTKIYAEQLNSSLMLDVVEAQSGMYLHHGQVVIAAGKRHLRVFRDDKGYFVTSERGIPVSGHCPSVDVLFSSAAVSAKSDAIGVILTGMGKDGARGMLSMKNAGAFTIAQDESSSVVYGMPKAAVDDGAVLLQCALDDIAAKINLRI